jgi:transcriptional regulator with XRE-family HTH domain
MKTSDTARIFGENVRARRLALKITQKELAARIPTYASHVSAIENGAKTLSWKSQETWAAALQTELYRLLTPRRKKTRKGR